MKIISWNVRGLGGFEKRREVCQLVREKNPFIMCIQESKLSVVDMSVCKSLWRDGNIDFSFQPSRGASGGLVTMWDCQEVEVWASFHFEHVLGIQGRLVKTGAEFTLLNVYAPCDISCQQVLWNNISLRLSTLVNHNVCVCGDFNTVRCEEERRSVGSAGPHAGSAGFNLFVGGNCLIDLPLRGRNFTWYRGDGRSMSRLDRFLLSESWCLTWPNCFQLASSRGISDHCPIQLSIDEANWGPRPVRLLKCWANFEGYHDFVRARWSSFQVEGWGGYVLKEKLKLIKLALKEWHQRHTKNIQARMSSLKEQISTLDIKGETMVLSEEEMEELHGYSADLFSLSKINSSICWQ
jgi:exonuclease III